MPKTKAHQKYKLRDGTIVPGCTTVINSQLGWNKQTLIAWTRRESLAGNDPEKVKDKAAEIGTIAHYLIECHIKGVEADLAEYAKADIDKAENAFLAFLEYEKQHQFKYIKSELELVSESVKFGGTIDLIAEQNGEKYLIDFKTSNGVYDEHYIQVAAYYYMALENNVDVKNVVILQIDKNDGSLHIHGVSKEKLEWGKEVFEHCRALYELKKAA